MAEPRALWVSLDAESAATMHPHDLAEYLLEHVAAVRAMDRVIPGELVRADAWSQHFRTHRGEIARNVGEALTWMLRTGLLAFQDAGASMFLMLRVSRMGASVLADRNFREFKLRNGDPHEVLHPRIVTEAYPLLVRGSHSTAVFEAFKSVEVAVRAKGRLPDTLLGTQLMRAAFDKNSGPLRNTAVTDPGERDAECHLFAGAIGYFKNPASHREVETEPRSALQALVLASQLLTIVDSREPAIP